MKLNWREFGIERNKVIEVADKKTAIVFSHKCKETFVMAVENNHVYYDCYPTLDIEAIRNRCVREHFSTDFIISSTDYEGVVFLRPAFATTGTALVIDEVLGNRWHLELHRTTLKDFQSRIARGTIIDI